MEEPTDEEITKEIQQIGKDWFNNNQTKPFDLYLMLARHFYKLGYEKGEQRGREQISNPELIAKAIHLSKYQDKDDDLEYKWTELERAREICKGIEEALRGKGKG